MSAMDWDEYRDGIYEGGHGWTDRDIAMTANEVINDLRAQVARLTAELAGARCDISDAKGNGLAERARAEAAEAREAEARAEIEAMVAECHAYLRTRQQRASDDGRVALGILDAREKRRALAGEKGGA